MSETSDFSSVDSSQRLANSFTHKQEITHKSVHFKLKHSVATSIQSPHFFKSRPSPLRLYNTQSIFFCRNGERRGTQTRDDGRQCRPRTFSTGVDRARHHRNVLQDCCFYTRLLLRTPLLETSHVQGCPQHHCGATRETACMCPRSVDSLCSHGG